MKLKKILFPLIIYLLAGCSSLKQPVKREIESHIQDIQVLFPLKKDEDFITLVNDLLLSHQWQLLADISESPLKELVLDNTLSYKEYCAVLFHSGWNDTNTALSHFDPDEIADILWTEKKAENSYLRAQGYFIIRSGESVSFKILIIKDEQQYLLLTE